MKTYIVTVDDGGTIRWHNEARQLDRENGPAVEYTDGDKSWYQNGERHRTDGPAIEYANGDKYWYQNGKLHRDDGPAIEYADGDESWYLNGERVSEADVMRLNETVDIEGTKYTLAQIKAALKSVKN